MRENSVKHLISCQDVLTKATMQTFELALLPRENYIPLTWLTVVYTKNCCLSCLVISFHARGNIDGNRKIVLGDRSCHFVPADNESQPRESLFLTASKDDIIYRTRNLFKTYYNY